MCVLVDLFISHHGVASVERYANLPPLRLTRISVLGVEIEKRVELQKLPTDLEDSSRIQQGKIVDEYGGKVHVRIRKTTDMSSNKVRCTLTVKDRLEHPEKSIEAETPITLTTFINLWRTSVIPGTSQIKIRHDHPSGWIVDEILQGNHAGTILAEYEFEDEAAAQSGVELPPSFKPQL